MRPCTRPGAASKALRRRAGGVSPDQETWRSALTITVSEAEQLQGRRAARSFASLHHGDLRGHLCDAANYARRPFVHAACADCRVLKSCAQAVVCFTTSSTERGRRQRNASFERTRAPDAARDGGASPGAMELAESVSPLWLPRRSMMLMSLCQHCWWPCMMTGVGQSRAAIDSSTVADGETL